jgi:uncharacterized protein involved in tolerance to divalent cations
VLEEETKSVHDAEEVKAAISSAIAENEEEKLSAAIDQARQMGSSYPWSRQLDKAEEILFEMTCGVEEMFRAEIPYSDEEDL